MISSKKRMAKDGPLIREDRAKSEMDLRREQEARSKAEIKQELEHPRWRAFWEKEFPPWFDLGLPNPALESLLDEGDGEGTSMSSSTGSGTSRAKSTTIPNGRALVPGCARGFDATALASEDRYVIGCDIVPLAIQSANQRLEEEMRFCEKLCVPYKPPLGKVEFREMSFFDFPTDQPEHLFDFIFDHGFLNALDHRVHDDYGKKIGELVKENGIVVTILYPVMEKEGGPPFAVSIDRVKRIFMANAFKPLQLEPLPPHLCMPGRGGDSDFDKRDDRGSNDSNAAVTVIGVWQKIYIDPDFDPEFDNEELEHSI
jgi:hypothetical protein